MSIFDLSNKAKSTTMLTISEITAENFNQMDQVENVFDIIQMMCDGYPNSDICDKYGIDFDDCHMIEAWADEQGLY